MDKDMGASPLATGPSQVEPEVSTLRASVPSACVWRTDSPAFGQRPTFQFVFIQGEKYHSGQSWMRAGWGTAAIRTTHAEDSFQGYRRADIERIARDNDMDIVTVDVVGWLPANPPAPTTETLLPRLAPCDDGEWSAQAIEARRAATGTGAVHESAVRQDAPESGMLGDDRNG